MANVHGFDTYSGVEFCLETTWGTTPGTPTWIRLPLISDGLVVEQLPLAKSRELGFGGAQPTWDAGAKTVKGTLRFNPYYNLKAQWMLFCHAFGGAEERTADTTCAGNAPTGTMTFSTHLFLPQSFKETTSGSIGGVPTGISFRAWRAGSASTTGHIEMFTGCIPTRWTWDQPENARPVVTLEFIGKVASSISDNGESLAALQSSPTIYPVFWRDVANKPTHAKCPGIAQAGYVNANPPTQVANLNLVSFRFDLNSNTDWATPFVNAIDSPQKPGHNNYWELTGELGMLLEDDFLANYRPAKQYMDRVTAKNLIRIRYVSDYLADSVCSPSIPYAIDLYAKNVCYEGAPTNIQGGKSNAVRIPFRGAKTPNGSGYTGANETAIGSSTLGLFLLQCHLNDTDDGGSTTVPSGQGGNLGAPLDPEP